MTRIIIIVLCLICAGYKYALERERQKTKELEEKLILTQKL